MHKNKIEFNSDNNNAHNRGKKSLVGCRKGVSPFPTPVVPIHMDGSYGYRLMGCIRGVFMFRTLVTLIHMGGGWRKRLE